jgi:hypothetical protein
LLQQLHQMLKINLIRFAFFLCAIIPTIATAQLDSEPRNLPKYDKQLIHFGFTLGINKSDFHIDRVADFKIRDSIYRVESSSITGLNLGIVSNLRLGEYFDLRFIPTLSFCQRDLNYDFVYPNLTELTTSKKIESTYLEFPLHIKYKSKRIDNYRVYVIGGVKFAFDMVSQAKVKSEDKDIVKLKKQDYGYEIGLGFDFYLTYFKFSPEIKMYNGVTNLLEQDYTVYSSAIDKLSSKTFVVSFLFE